MPSDSREPTESASTSGERRSSDETPVPAADPPTDDGESSVREEAANRVEAVPQAEASAVDEPERTAPADGQVDATPVDPVPPTAVPAPIAPVNPRRGLQSLIREAEGLVRAGSVLDAAPLFERALELAPRDNHALIGMARVSLARGDTSRAVEFAERAVRLRSRRVPYRLTLAEALAANGQDDEARAQYLRVVRQDPGNTVALAALREL